MDWWSASVDQFVKIPWDKITMGCHEVNHQIMCYDYKPTNAFYKSIDLPVTMHSSNNESMWVVAGWFSC